VINPVRYVFLWIVRRLSTAGFVDAYRGERIADLTWPRFLTMFGRHSQRVADVAMVGLAVGPAGIAGLAFATVFYGLGNGFSLGLAGGTIGQVSQRFGADQPERLDLAVKQSVWVGTVIALPFTLVFWQYAEPLLALLADTPETVELGATYLRILSVAMVFNFFNTVSSRTLAGADDTVIAMAVRATGAFTNIFFNAILIFGLGLGIEGAAIGTVVAELLVSGCFIYGFVLGGLPIVGEFPIHLSLSGPYFDRGLSKQLMRLSLPLMGRSLARMAANFPLFALLAVFGPTVVAAFEVGRRIRSLMRSTGAGFSMAASSLVGQALGRDDELAADDYSRDSIRISAATYLVSVVLVLVFAGPLTHLFVDDPAVVSQTTPFIRIAAISFLGYGMDSTFTGILKAAGDNQWALYGRLFGKYIAMLPIIYLGTVTPLGILAVYVAIIAETWSAGTITGYRVRSGVWKQVSRRHRPAAVDD